MRESLNYLLPYVDHDMNAVSFHHVAQFPSITANGYYGYYPLPVPVGKGEAAEAMDTQPCETETDAPSNTNRHASCRKRGLRTDAESAAAKRRRENDSSPPNTFPQRQQPALACGANLRAPTHNVPDVPHRITGHYI